MAWQWLFAAFILIMLSAAHIFEIPFMVFDPTAFKKGNDSSALCNATDAAPATPPPVNVTRARVMNRLLKDDIGPEEGHPYEHITRLGQFHSFAQRELLEAKISELLKHIFNINVKINRNPSAKFHLHQMPDL